MGRVRVQARTRRNSNNTNNTADSRRCRSSAVTSASDSCFSMMGSDPPTSSPFSACTTLLMTYVWPDTDADTADASSRVDSSPGMGTLADSLRMGVESSRDTVAVAARTRWFFISCAPWDRGGGGQTCGGAMWQLEAATGGVPA